MKIVSQKPAGSSKALLLRTTPLNFLRSVNQSNFKEGHAKFDVATYNSIVKSIRGSKPCTPCTIYVTPQGIPTLFQKAQGLYVARAAINLGIENIDVYTFVVEGTSITNKDALSKFPKGFVASPNGALPNKWSNYSWYQFKPKSGRPTMITDVKGDKFDLDPGTKFGALPTRAGIRIVDADNVKSFFVLKEQRFNKLIENSVKLRKSPIIVAPPIEPATVTTPKVTIIVPDESYEKPRVVVDNNVGDLEDTEEVENEEVPNRPIHVEELQVDDNTIDDLSVELFGHHMSEFDVDAYEDLDSLSSDGMTLGEAYRSFFEKNKKAEDSKASPSVAENYLVSVVRDLFKYLYDHGFEPSVIQGIEFQKPLENASAAIERWKKMTKSQKIKHLVVKVGNLILDPCFKRLGKAVSIDNYPVAEFQRMWKQSDTLATPTPASRLQHSGLFTKPIKELQVPEPVLDGGFVVASSKPTKIKITL